MNISNEKALIIIEETYNSLVSNGRDVVIEIYTRKVLTRVKLYPHVTDEYCEYTDEAKANDRLKFKAFVNFTIDIFEKTYPLTIPLPKDYTRVTYLTYLLYYILYPETINIDSYACYEDLLLNEFEDIDIETADLQALANNLNQPIRPNRYDDYEILSVLYTRINAFCDSLPYRGPDYDRERYALRKNKIIEYATNMGVTLSEIEKESIKSYESYIQTYFDAIEYTCEEDEIDNDIDTYLDFLIRLFENPDGMFEGTLIENCMLEKPYDKVKAYIDFVCKAKRTTHTDMVTRTIARDLNSSFDITDLPNKRFADILENIHKITVWSTNKPKIIPESLFTKCIKILKLWW